MAGAANMERVASGRRVVPGAVPIADGADPEAAEAADLVEIIARFETPLLRYVGAMLGRDEDAQDVVQETFLSYCRFARRTDAAAVRNLSAWLFSVAHNLSQDVLRKRQRDRKAQAALTAAAAAEAAPVETAAEGDAVDRVIRQAASERALAELRKLPEEQRQVLLLKIVQDMSLREIAKVTGLSFGNVAYRLNQGLKELARRLKEAGVL